jgi:hypothetical protein
VVRRGGGRKGWSEGVVRRGVGRGGGGAGRWNGSSSGGASTEQRLERVVNNEVQERLGRVMEGTGRQKRSTKAGTGRWSGSSETFKEEGWNG